MLWTIFAFYAGAVALVEVTLLIYTTLRHIRAALRVAASDGKFPVADLVKNVVETVIIALAAFVVIVAVPFAVVFTLTHLFS